MFCVVQTTRKQACADACVGRFPDGPCGETACANVTQNNLWIDGVRELFKQTKTAAPNTTVIGYSQEQSAVGIWRVGLSDVEALVGDGFIDVGIPTHQHRLSERHRMSVSVSTYVGRASLM